MKIHRPPAQAPNSSIHAAKQACKNNISAFTLAELLAHLLKSKR